jgi:hypothetical protein
MNENSAEIFLVSAVILPTYANAVPIESGARISRITNPQKLANAAAALIEAHGWKCDSVSALIPFLTSRGFTITCNNYSYMYETEDKWGNWEVRLK